MTLRDELGRLSRYGVVGLVSNLLLYLVFIALLRMGLAPEPAAGLCYVLGVGVSYLGNRRFTFASDKGHVHDLPRYLAAYAIGLGATLVFIWALSRLMAPEIAQILNIGMTAGVIYASLRLLRFG